jgi:polyphosphate kinase
MLRNLEHRIEVTIPIEDENSKNMIREILDIQLRDNCKARLITGDGKHVVKTPARDEAVIRSQVAVMEYLCHQNE